MSTNKLEDKITTKTLILVLVITVFAVIVFSGRFQSYFINFGSFSPKLIDVETSSGYNGFDYVVYADITIGNVGKEGKVTIKCTLYSDTEEYVKTETIDIGAQSEVTHRIMFPEARTSIQYTLRVELT